MQALADSGVLWILVFTALGVVYLLPTLVGAIRRVDGLALVFLVNLIGAPTGVGWLGAMIMAFGPRRLPPRHWCRGHRARTDWRARPAVNGRVRRWSTGNCRRCAGSGF